MVSKHILSIIIFQIHFLCHNFHNANKKYKILSIIDNPIFSFLSHSTIREFKRKKKNTSGVGGHWFVLIKKWLNTEKVPIIFKNFFTQSKCE